MKISTKIILTFVFSVLLVSCLLIFLNSKFSSDLTQFFTHKSYDELVNARKENLKDDVETINQMMREIYNGGKEKGLSDDEIKKEIFRVVSKLKFFSDKTGYIFIYDYDGVVLMHPEKPSLVGKNLIGSFYQPKAVFCEINFLKTLPKREFAAGVAEALKMAITFDKEMFGWLKSVNLDDENLAKLVEKSINLKARVVEQDEKEKGLRAILNYGHTFAHVIENETNYKEFLHGEAVAIGMNMANRLSVRLGLMSEAQAEEIRQVLEKFDLPVSYKIENEYAFYEAFFMDKKTKGDKINFIIADKIGSAFIKNDVKKEDVLETLREFK